MKNYSVKGIMAAAFLLMLCLGACEKKTYESIQTVDTQKISSFISKNNLNMKLSDSGYYYNIVKNGNGKVLKYSDSVAYFMTIKSLSGTTYFETNAYNASETLLGYATPFVQVQQTLLGLNNGATVRVLLPSHLAYGLNGSTGFGIGANENLDIQVKTVPITNRAQYEDSVIKKYISDKGITGMVKNADGIYIKINTPGKTDTLVHSAESIVTANYTLRLLGYDESKESGTLTNSLSGLIKGWASVLVGQGKGVTLRCIIPSRWGYGNAINPKTGVSLSTGVTPNAILDYDITITSVVNPVITAQ